MTKRDHDLNVKLEYIYELYKLSLINARYYGWKLAHTQRLSTAIEVVIALGATGTGAAGLKAILAQSQDATLQSIWILLAILSAILAIIKPILQLNRKIETYTKLFTGHNAGYFALKDIVIAVGTYHSLTAELERQFGSIKNRYRELATLDDPSPSRRKIEQIRIQVNNRLPDDALWWFGDKSPADLDIERSSEGPENDRATNPLASNETVISPPSILHRIGKRSRKEPF
jgi:hypothetical protein